MGRPIAQSIFIKGGTTVDRLNFKLEVFEGPLDLMLHLIAKHKLNINDISITELLEQYLDYIERIKLADLEVASEFLAMAAHLVYIKTVSLLPKHEEAEVLKKELEGRLLEYQLCKETAQRLSSRYQGHNIFVRKPQKLAVDKVYTGIHEKTQLLHHYLVAIGKAKRYLPPPRTAFTGIVSRRMVSVTSRIIFILKKLYDNNWVPYQEFFSQGDRSELVATFLAMLELIKSKRIVISNDNQYVYFNQQIDFSQPFEEEIEDIYQ